MAIINQSPNSHRQAIKMLAVDILEVYTHVLQQHPVGISPIDAKPFLSTNQTAPEDPQQYFYGFPMRIGALVDDGHLNCWQCFVRWPRGVFHFHFRIPFYGNGSLEWILKWKWKTSLGHRSFVTSLAIHQYASCRRHSNIFSVP